MRAARRRVAAKRKKLKNLGKSKSTDTEDEDADDDCGEDGESKEKINAIERYMWICRSDISLPINNFLTEKSNVLSIEYTNMCNVTFLTIVLPLQLTLCFHYPLKAL